MSDTLANTSAAPPARQELRALINSDAVRAQIARAVPKHMTPDRFLRVATTAMLRTPKLAQCDQTSFMKALLDLSALGLEPDGRRAHLIPFENRKLGIVECQLIVDYKGLIELAKRSGEVAFWHAYTVCENDKFTWVNGVVTHEVNWFKPRGKTLAVYSHVRNKEGADDDYEVMTLEEIDRIRARSRAATSGPWVTDYDEMAKKTVMRRHSKRLTLSPEFHDAVNKGDDTPAGERDVTPSTAMDVFKLPDVTEAPALEAPVIIKCNGDHEEPPCADAGCWLKGQGEPMPLEVAAPVASNLENIEAAKEEARRTVNALMQEDDVPVISVRAWAKKQNLVASTTLMIRSYPLEALQEITARWAEVKEFHAATVAAK